MFPVVSDESSADMTSTMATKVRYSRVRLNIISLTSKFLYTRIPYTMFCTNEDNFHNCPSEQAGKRLCRRSLMCNHSFSLPFICQCGHQLPLTVPLDIHARTRPRNIFRSTPTETFERSSQQPSRTRLETAGSAVFQMNSSIVCRHLTTGKAALDICLYFLEPYSPNSSTFWRQKWRGTGLWPARRDRFI